MTDQERFIRMVANMEGETVTPYMAKMARDLFGPAHQQVNAPLQDAMDMMKSQLLILMLKDLGGDITYTVDQIDNDTRDYVLTAGQGADGNTMRFTILRKDSL